MCCCFSCLVFFLHTSICFDRLCFCCFCCAFWVMGWSSFEIRVSLIPVLSLMALAIGWPQSWSAGDACAEGAGCCAVLCCNMHPQVQRHLVLVLGLLHVICLMLSQNHGNSVMEGLSLCASFSSVGPPSLPDPLPTPHPNLKEHHITHNLFHLSQRQSLPGSV